MASPNKDSKIVNDFYHAATTLCANEDTFSQLTATLRKNLLKMRSYLDNLPMIIDAAVNASTGIQSDETEHIVHSRAYRSCSKTLTVCDQFLDKKEKQLTHRLPSSHESFVIRVHALPMNSDSIHRMTWMAGQYRLAVPVAIEKHEEAVALFGEHSEKLPISYREYRKRGATFYAKFSELSSLSQRRVLALETFPALSRYTKLRVMHPRNPG